MFWMPPPPGVSTTWVSGPLQNAAFSSRQLLLRFFELAFGTAHMLALDWIELSVNCQTGVHGCLLSLLLDELLPSGG
jgi:hypothetical protein